jgi:hypothetical protein
MHSMKNYSVKLTNALAAKLEAVCEMHPHKKPAQVLADLLTLALTEIERRADEHTEGGTLEFHTDPSQSVYLLGGPFAEFHGLVRKHRHALSQRVDEDEDTLAPVVARAYQLGNSE